MKKLVLTTAAAVALLAMPAQAQNYGNDAIAWIDLEASADEFCALTATVEGAQNNAEIVDEDTTGAGYVFSDARIRFDLQNLVSPTQNNTVAEANTIRSARAVLRFPASQCNTGFSVQASSTNGGLENDDFASFDDNFTDVIDYSVGITFDDTVAIPQTLATAGQFINEGGFAPEFGLFRVDIRVPASNKRMLEGAYEDFLVVQMTPDV
jgi:hypothetical protein